MAHDSEHHSIVHFGSIDSSLVNLMPDFFIFRFIVFSRSARFFCWFPMLLWSYCSIMIQFKISSIPFFWSDQQLIISIFQILEVSLANCLFMLFVVQNLLNSKCFYPLYYFFLFRSVFTAVGYSSWGNRLYSPTIILFSLITIVHHAFISFRTTFPDTGYLMIFYRSQFSKVWILWLDHSFLLCLPVNFYWFLPAAHFSLSVWLLSIWVSSTISHNEGLMTSITR